MRSLILVSSQTGNTWKIARFMRRALGPQCRLCRTDETADVLSCDLVLVGFWLDSGHVDEAAASVLTSLRGKKTGIFATLGGDPNSNEAHKVMQSAVDMLMQVGKGNVLLGTFMCQGRIDAAVIERLYELFPHLRHDKGHQARIRAAASHPDADDKLRALLTARRWYLKAQRLCRTEHGV